jgi:hypothetical protein
VFTPDQQPPDGRHDLRPLVVAVVRAAIAQALLFEFQIQQQHLVVQETGAAAQADGIRFAGREQFPQRVLLAAGILEGRVIERVGKAVTGTIRHQVQRFGFGDQITLRGDATALSDLDRRPANAGPDLQTTGNTDADQAGARPSLLLIQIVETVIQMPAGQHLVGFENRIGVLFGFHGVVRNQKFQVRVVRSG